MFTIYVGVQGFKGSGVPRFRFTSDGIFDKVPFSSLDCIWDAYLREKRRFRQA